MKQLFLDIGKHAARTMIPQERKKQSKWALQSPQFSAWRHITDHAGTENPSTTQECHWVHEGRLEFRGAHVVGICGKEPEWRELYKEKAPGICIGICSRLQLNTQLCTHRVKFHKIRKEQLRNNQSLSRAERCLSVASQGGQASLPTESRDLRVSLLSGRGKTALQWRLH